MKNYTLNFCLAVIISSLPNLAMAQSYTIGAPSPAIGASATFTALVQYKLFDVLNAGGVYIDTVDMYPTAAIGSPFTIVVQNASTTVIASFSDSTTVSSGSQRVPVGMFIPAGTGYRMGFSVNPGVLRNSTGAVYPYTVPNVMSITGNTFNVAYYYFFYNIKIHIAPPVTDVAAAELVAPLDSICDGSQAVRVKIKNMGPAILNSTTINWKVNGVAQNSYVFSGVIPVGDSSTATIGNYNFTNGNLYDVVVKSTNPNGLTDPNPANDSVFRDDVFVHPLPAATPFDSMVEVCDGDSTAFMLALAGSPPWSVKFNNGISTVTHSGIINSSYAIEFKPANNVTYSVYAVSDGNGCTSTDTSSTSFIVKPLPVVDLGADTTVCFYESLTFTIDPGFTSYAWSNGATTNSTTIDSSGVGFGLKTVYVTVDLDGCGASDTVNILFDPCLGISEAGHRGDYKIYPNPSSGLFTIAGTEIINGGHIQITDLSGNLVFEATAATVDLIKGFEVDLSGKNAGVYIVRLTSSEGSEVMRLVKF